MLVNLRRPQGACTLLRFGTLDDTMVTSRIRWPPIHRHGDAPTIVRENPRFCV
jgi:hypothetical protein